MRFVGRSMNTHLCLDICCGHSRNIKLWLLRCGHMLWTYHNYYAITLTLPNLITMRGWDYLDLIPTRPWKACLSSNLSPSYAQILQTEIAQPSMCLMVSWCIYVTYNDRPLSLSLFFPLSLSLPLSLCLCLSITHTHTHRGYSCYYGQKCAVDTTDGQETHACR